MKIHKGDNVIMVRGKDAGKKGKVLDVFTENNKVVVEGLNLVKRHLRPKKQGQKGQIIEVPRKVDASSVQIICSKCNKKSRVGYLIKESGEKVRICKKCEAQI